MELQLERGPERELCLELEFKLERKLEPGLEEELELELHFPRALELQAEVSFRCASPQVALGGMYVVADPFLRALKMLWRELGAKPPLALVYPIWR